MKSIRTQMLVYLMVGAIILFSALAVVSSAKLNELPEYILGQYREIVNARAAEVSKELNGFVEQIKMVSQMSVIQSMDLNGIKEFLPDLVLEGKHRNMTIADLDGLAWSTLNSNFDISNQEQYQKIIVEQRDLIISQPFISPFAEPDRPITIISHAVKNNGQIVGLTNIVIEIEFLNNIVRQIEIMDSGYGWIVNREGLIVAHPDSKIPISQSMENFITDEKVINEILHSQSGTVEYSGISGEKMVAVFSKIENAPDWTFIISIPVHEVYAEVVGVRNTILTAIISGLGLVIIFSFIYSATISRPILNLREIFEKAANGNLHVRADETIPNEVGIAAKSFNQMLEQIKNLTYKDPITCLYNYNGFSLELPHKLKRLSDEYQIVAIAIISIDDFKRINSISGYEAGNIVLQSLAQRLNELITSEEVVARYFGDEFIMVLGEKNDSTLERRIDRIGEQCSRGITIKDNEFILKTSLGVSLANSKEVSIEQLVYEATIAKHKVKKTGGNGYQFYNSEINELIKEEQKIENALLYAVEKEELYLVYQPILDVATKKIVATEALLRWRHETYGNVSLLRIIEIAEKGGLITKIGNWVLKEACRQNTYWHNLGHPSIVVSVNVSPIQFEQMNFVEVVRQSLEETGMSPCCLELEITETNAMTGVEDKIDKMKLLKEMGIRIAIDDFGTGYSSLAYFTRFPIDTLKIDRSFINNMLNDENANTIVNTIISMAQAINISATAEGVETVEQLELLQEKGCDKIQGYLISRPIESQLLEALF